MINLVNFTNFWNLGKVILPILPDGYVFLLDADGNFILDVDWNYIIVVN